MLDINFIRQHPQEVKDACLHKQLDAAVVDQLLSVDEKKRALQVKVDQMRQQSNQNAQEIKNQIAQGQQASQELIQKGKRIKDELKKIEPDLSNLENKFLELMLAIPNIPSADTPIGSDETFNKVVREEGQIPHFTFPILAHQELMEKANWLDTKRAVKVAGFRAYFLKNDGLRLERALLSYALDLMTNFGFEVMSVPTLVKPETMVGTGFFPWGKEDHYYTQNGQILAGTAEVALTSYYQNELLREKDLPIKLCGISPCYRREIGTHGKDTKGIIRVHQFNKVEQVVLTIADEEETRNWHTKMLKYSEQLLQDLGLPYRVVAMCTGDMGAGQRKKYDLETWFPSQNTYRETHSASYFNDFQARRLNIRYQAKDGSIKYVYTLNNTVAASPRLLAALVENYQQKDATIEIPKVLKKYF
ncbi:MAG TPA: serine--tRNA ligase [Candidatus Woesebacteria bacterium]|jgi:seryl-tRNA synthetase|nr:serine--tRNA ligase [Candidatus Woesebacteria bacterium]